MSTNLYITPDPNMGLVTKFNQFLPFTCYSVRNLSNYNVETVTQPAQSIQHETQMLNVIFNTIFKYT